MSYADRLARAVLLAGIFVTSALAGALALHACGPYFPQWLLTDEARLLEAPTTWFKEAVESIVLPRPWDPRYRRKPESLPKAVLDAEKGPYRQTAETDQWEIETAVSDRHLTARYAEIRQALLQHSQEVAAWRRESAWGGGQTPPQPPDLEVPAGLPGELADYLEGAIAYHRGELERARAAWERLLERPASERRQRSTWAAYMLGKANLPKHPADAVHWFERTRELASKELFPDPLGLAATSFGWQARAELRLRQPDKALQHYFEQMKTGDPTALESMRSVTAKLIDDPKGLEIVARSDDARPVLTAYVISVWDRTGDGGGLDPGPARRWLAAIRAVEPQNVADADRLAWVAYRAGDFTAAGEWLKRAPDDSPMTSWIQAKLLMRAGRLAEAESSLRFAGIKLPPALDQVHDPFTAYEHGMQPALRPRAEGERGASLLARGDYTGALGTLLHAGYWSEAAYVAERVLTTDELRAYADQSWPAVLASHRPEDYGDGWNLIFGGFVTPSKERMAYLLRYLAGRRLVREGRYGEAEKFLPTSLGLPLRTLARSIAEGRDAHRPVAERAEALFRAACTCRHLGLELLGTELDPDWFVYEGQFETDPFAQTRVTRKSQRLGPTQDERDRAIRSQVEPAKRFHYRYRAMDLAQEAAALLPDGSEERARFLATAGNWVEGRDPEAAKPLLAALLSCCGATEIGRAARRLNAIPNVEDACPADIRRRPGT